MPNPQTYVALTRVDEMRPYTDIIGPFQTPENALAWVKSLPNAHISPDDHPHWPGAVTLEPQDGGWECFELVNEEKATLPKDYWHWTNAIEEDEVVGVEV